MHILVFQGFLVRIVDLSFFATKMNTKSTAGPVTLKTLTYFFFQHDGLSRNDVENFVIGNSNSANIVLALVPVTHELQRKDGII